ncbi:hypothetical protein QLH51_16925 [Sphingomonas sp. 2R-10]|uniref:hypothetical protein n=1 Tax=Sphingomonas sp. 2R-10 TaxID=3045148 RepID=UPI000F7693CA|nr:hypothetical protein [Sphingomonas sp. 2R-10]MDJ0278482.1 hypothetical protein [Sphingomonas sp. 2R-10]
MPILIFFVFAVTLGPLMAWMYSQPKQVEAFEARRRKVLATGGKDPANEPFGAHRPFLTNVIWFGGIAGAGAALVSWMMGA